MNIEEHKWILCNPKTSTSLLGFIFANTLFSSVTKDYGDIESSELIRWLAILQQNAVADQHLDHELLLLPALFFTLNNDILKKLMVIFNEGPVLNKLCAYVNRNEFHIGLLEWRALASLCMNSKTFLIACFDKILDIGIKELAFIVATIQGSWQRELSPNHRLLLQSIFCCLHSIFEVSRRYDTIFDVLFIVLIPFLLTKNDFSVDYKRALVLHGHVVKCLDRLQPIHDNNNNNKVRVDSRSQSRSSDLSEDCLNDKHVEVAHNSGGVVVDETRRIEYYNSPNKSSWVEICRVITVGIIIRLERKVSL